MEWRLHEYEPIWNDYGLCLRSAAASSKNSVSFGADGRITFSENCCSTTGLCLIWTTIYLVSVGPVVIGSVEGLGNVLNVKNQVPLWQNKNSKKLCMTNYKIGCKTNDGRIGRNVRIYVISTKTRRVFTTVLGIGRWTVYFLKLIWESNQRSPVKCQISHVHMSKSFDQWAVARRMASFAGWFLGEADFVQ